LYSPSKIQFQKIRFRVAGKVCLKSFVLLHRKWAGGAAGYCFEPVTRKSALWWFGRFAFRNDGIVKFCAKGVRKFVNLILAINLNGLLGSVADNVAVVAPSEVLLKFSLQVGIQRTVKKIV
jgi:hypothetical protein